MVEFAKKVERIGKRVLIKNNYPGTILRKYFLGVVTLITRESHAPGGPVGRSVHRGPLCRAWRCGVRQLHDQIIRFRKIG